jgi:hypothetical protein
MGYYEKKKRNIEKEKEENWFINSLQITWDFRLQIGYTLLCK